MIGKYSDDVTLDFSPDIMDRHQRFVDAVRNAYGVDLKATSGRDSMNVHAPNSYHKVDAVDYSWDDLNSWDNPLLSKIGDLAKQYGFGEVISDAHGTGPHIHVGNYIGGAKTVQAPIQYTNPVNGQTILNMNVEMPQTDYKEKYNQDVLKSVLNTKYSNPDASARDAYMNDLTVLRSVLGAGNTSEANKEIMPYINKMMELDMKASSTGTIMDNQDLDKANAIKALQAIGDSKNPTNQAMYAAIANMAGIKFPTEALSYQHMNPTTLLQGVLSSANNNANNAMQKYGLDVNSSLRAQEIANSKINSDRSYELAKDSADFQKMLAIGKLTQGEGYNPEQANIASKNVDTLIQDMRGARDANAKKQIASDWLKVHGYQASKYHPMGANGIFQFIEREVPGFTDYWQKSQKQ